MHNLTTKPLVLLTSFAIILAGFFSPASLEAKTKLEEWRRDVPCGHRLASPISADITGCSSAYCINTSDSSQVCACVRTDESEEIDMMVRNNKALIQHWDTGIQLIAGITEFRIDAADLDKDGTEEWVIAVLESVSNGMGIGYWKVWALSGDKLSNSIEVEDYGSMGFLSSDGNKCRLLATRWIPGWEPERNSGLYLAGVWFELDSDHYLRPTFERPAIKRRYLESFQRLRNEGSFQDAPLMWYRDLRTTPITGPYPFQE